MLNLKAAKEMAAKELGSSGSKSAGLGTSPRTLEKTRSPDETLAPASRFQVGDRVEYRSDTHKQWLQGVVQRVREGGAVYDLDVKKGAQANKLRHSRNGTQDLFDRIDANHDGVISRTEFRGALQTHVIEGGDSLVAPSSPPLLTQASAGSTGRLSRGSTDGPSWQKRADMTSNAKRRTGNDSSLMSVPYGGEDVSMQARQLHNELRVATRSIQQRQMEWAEAAGRDMGTRAGAFTVRTMVQTAKELIQSFEGTLIRRMGSIAGCFHAWRHAVEITKVEGLHRETLEQHHDAWAAHFNNHQKSFEDELRAHARKEMTAKEKRQQQAFLLIDQWAEGEKKGITRSTWRAWSTYAHKERSLKKSASSIHAVIFAWAEGKVKGTAHACLLSWKHITETQREVRKKEAEMEKLHQGHQQKIDEETRKRDEEMAAKLKEIEARRKDRSSSVEAIMLQWEKGKNKGIVALPWKSWANFAKNQASKGKRSKAVEMQVRKFLEGDRRGTLHTSFLTWKSEAKASHAARMAEDAKDKETAQMRKTIQDMERKMNGDMELYKTEEEKRKAAAKAQIQYIANKWAMGDKKGTKKSVLNVWQKYTRDVKQMERTRKAIYTALAKSLEGSDKGNAHAIFLNWHMLAKSEKLERSKEDAVAAEKAKMDKFFADTQAAHDDEREKLMTEAERAKDAARAALIEAVSKWAKGDEQGLIVSVFKEWQNLVEETCARARNREAVKDQVAKFIMGDQKGALLTALAEWKNYVKIEAVHNRAHQQNNSKIDSLEKQLATALEHRKQHLLKYVAKLAGGRSDTQKHLVFSAWKGESKGAAATLEKEREQKVLMDDLERERKMNETRIQELRARAAGALGCKNDKVVLTIHFEAWSLLWQQENDARIDKMNKNKAMVKYSEFIIKKIMTKDASALLSSTFAEWHREGKVLLHERLHSHGQSTVQSLVQRVAELEAQNVDLQDQLGLYYQQIDLITETLQKELKTKEELANELRVAYDKMRKSSTPISSTRAGTGTGIWDQPGAWSRASSPRVGRGGQRDDGNDSTPRLQTTPRTSMGGNGKLEAKVKNSSGNRTIPTEPITRAAGGSSAPELPGAPTLPRARTSRGGGLDSPQSLDWNVAVHRMEDEGLVHLDD